MEKKMALSCPKVAVDAKPKVTLLLKGKTEGIRGAMVETRKGYNQW